MEEKSEILQDDHRRIIGFIYTFIFIFFLYYTEVHIYISFGTFCLRKENVHVPFARIKQCVLYILF